MTNNLNSIEQVLLALPQVKQGLQLAEITKLQRSEGNAKKAKFTATLKLSKVVAQAVEYFNSDECKAIFQREGLVWTTEDFANKVFGWQKSYFYKVVKVGKLDDEVVTRFNAKCDELDAQGQDPNRSVEGLLKWVRATAEAEAETEESNGGGEEGSEEGGEESAEASVEVRVPTLLTLSFKATEVGYTKNVSLRINANGDVVTNNTPEEIALAIEFLSTSLRG